MTNERCQITNGKCSWLGRRLWFRRDVNFARFHGVSLFIRGPVAIDINLHQDLVRLAVSRVSGIKAEAVLIAQQRVDGLEYALYLAFEGHRVVAAACVFGEGLQ